MTDAQKPKRSRARPRSVSSQAETERVLAGRPDPRLTKLHLEDAFFRSLRELIGIQLREMEAVGIGDCHLAGSLRRTLERMAARAKEDGEGSLTLADGQSDNPRPVLRLVDGAGRGS